jgi:hypothetical protein
MSEPDQNRRIEKHCPNGCFLIGKLTLGETPEKGCLWPIPVI